MKRSKIFDVVNCDAIIFHCFAYWYIITWFCSCGYWLSRFFLYNHGMFRTYFCQNGF